ncbi:MucR family transcriptional regulator [Dongia mobilis]|uniref:MucR family transcriptional regulator n=1 Tax=Dongia mobilis TaxID=578943 RepID=A0A4R6X2C7_9PROT|nr:MucR family transcriptional regulator [Dongia mobilis]TDQ85424.1 MucR family transcriptional regulator [Dongia mobilis]
MTDAPQNDPLLPMVTEIVVAYLSHNTVAMADIPRLIAETRQALAQLGRPGSTQVNGNAGQSAGEPAVAIKKSVTPDYIICLEDGMKLKMLKRHLRTAYDMSPEQYRQKWGLPADYPMVAPNYAKKRSSLAREFGLGKAGGRASGKAKTGSGKAGAGKRRTARRA